MKRYDERVLHLLLDKYENSLLYEEKNKVHISIFVPVNKRTLPEYFDVTSTAYDTIQEQLLELESKGYITLEWGKRKKHILEKCILNTHRADEVYQFLHRTPRKEKEAGFLQICKKLHNTYASQICRCFLDWIIKKITSGESIREYANLDDPEEFEHLIKLLYAVECNTEELFLRQLSIQVFHDSKMAEQEIRKVAGILYRFRDYQPDISSIREGKTPSKDISERIPSYENGSSENISNRNITYENISYEDILAEYHIFRNPSWVMLKGSGSFSMKNRTGISNKFQLHALPGGIGISNEDIHSLCWDAENTPTYIITIENLTSFHQWNPADGGLCIYIGGYANTPVRQMLKKLYRTFPEIPFYHFGDIDCGGFQIWKNLCQSTEIPFLPKGMDLQTYTDFRQYGRELTLHDRKQLSIMMNDDWFQNHTELFAQMLQDNLKLEQECIKCPPMDGF